MATRFSQQFNRLGAPLLIRQFGESIVYYAGGTGAGRTIDAIIEREVQVITDAGIPALQTLITVRDSNTLGISATEIDSGRDKVTVSLRVGETAQTRQIARVVSTDNSMVQFEVN
jgi:hypothetical protein